MICNNAIIKKFIHNRLQTLKTNAISKVINKVINSYFNLFKIIL